MPTMRRLVILTVLATAVLAAGAVAGERERPGCTAAAMQPIAESRDVVLFREPTHEGVLLVGCLRVSDDPARPGSVYTELDLREDRDDGSWWSKPALAGTRVAWVAEHRFRELVRHIVLADLRTGDSCRVQPVPATPGSEAVAVRELLVTRRGALAYVVVAPGVRAVVVHDGVGAHVVGRSPAIDPRSLRRRGVRLTWRDGADTDRASLARDGIDCSTAVEPSARH